MKGTRPTKTGQPDLLEEPQFKKMISENDMKDKDLEEQKRDGNSVAPRWVKLTDYDAMSPEERAAEEEWEKKKKKIRDPPGGKEALRTKPNTYGWRMGIRVPTVCSCQ